MRICDDDDDYNDHLHLENGEADDNDNDNDNDNDDDNDDDPTSRDLTVLDLSFESSLSTSCSGRPVGIVASTWGSSGF